MMTPYSPSENNNLDYIESHEQQIRQRNSTLRQILHTAPGGIGDPRVLYYEHDSYIELEDGIMLAVEQ